MRKRYWVLTVSVFILGVAVGIAGHLFWQASIQPETNSPNSSNATKVDAIKSSLPGFTLPDPNGSSNDVESGSVEGEGEGQENNDNADNALNLVSVSKSEQEKIIADYKLAIGILFDAWKVKDMPAFRTQIANGYAGELMESHIKKAEKFLPKGIGLYVTNVQFDDIDIESADKNSATISAIYRYTVRDYDLDEEYPVGDEVNHFVHVRANLVKFESQWKITGETVI